MKQRIQPQDKAGNKRERFTVSYEPSPRVAAYLTRTKDATGATYKWIIEQAMIAKIGA